MKPPPLVQFLQNGLAAHQAGRLDEARTAYQQALALSPKNPDALHLLGVVLGAQGEVDRGIDLIAKAVRLIPRNPSFLYNLGNLHLQRKGFAEAAKNYRLALTQNPKMADAWGNLGLAESSLNRQTEAREAWRRALALNPRHTDNWLRVAESFRDQGLLKEAEETYLTAATHIPGHVSIIRNLANIYSLQQRHREAVDTCRKALELAPNNHEVWNNLGIVLQKLNDFQGAVAAFEQSIRLKPDYADAYINMAPALQQLGRFDEAIAASERAIALDPTQINAHTNLASVLQRLNRIDDTIAACERAIATNPTQPDTYTNLGRALLGLNRLDEAIAAFSQARKIDPSNASARKNESMARLRKGELRAGFELYESRWEEAEFIAQKRELACTWWRGDQSLKGRSILLHAEQGLGDTIQFARYASILAEQGASVILEAPVPLFELMSDLPGPAQIFRRGEPIPATDFHCPLLSLPFAMRTDLDSVPAKIPYLRPRTPQIARWQAETAGLTGLKVGIVWSGNPNHKNDHNRSLPFTLFQKIFACRGASFVVLQKDIRADEQPFLTACPNLHNWSADFGDFAQTAGLIQQLDLIVSVDTSIAHLAGAMGKPTWILLPFAPDWRWMGNSDRNPWYPCMKLFRQPQIGDWDTVLTQVSTELTKLGSAQPPSSA